jgi:hypothetical protein
MSKALLIAWMAVTAAILGWHNLSPAERGGFQTRWPDMPPSINLETYTAARKAAARSSYCMWTGPDTACRVS